MLGILKTKTAPPEPDLTMVVPRIKHTDFLVAVESMAMRPDDTPVTEPLVGDLLVTYAFDLPTTFQMFTARDLERLQLPPSELRATAVSNLKKQIGTIGRDGEPPLLRMVVGNNLEACLLLIDEIWQSLGTQILPEIVVGVPTRDVLLLTTTQSTKGGLGMLRAAVADAHQRETTHALSKNLLVRRADKWVVFE